MRQNRREFIRSCAAISAGIVCGSGALLVSGCSSVQYVPFATTENAFVVKKAAFGAQPFVLIKSREFPAPIYIARLAEGNYAAVLLQCTHKQCEVSAGPGLLICPCHGSEFSVTGEVVSPPAEKNLYAFKVRADAENVYIEAP
ncbi:MAG: Rieske (2Fe-2S) protein [Calditrichaceae bacterium]|nr:Rieske (2Fe-2S) protein [Calditrichia bacterium]NUQ40800.1 Rieske (2Fe-2S) protein [Calditrichaceae bacterium]